MFENLKSDHKLCAAECGALLGVGASCALFGWFRSSWSIKKFCVAAAATVLTTTALGVASGDFISHSTMMSFIKPFAHCGSVGMVVFGGAATGFKLLIDESIYGSSRVLAASLAAGMAAAYVTGQVMNGNISL